MIYDIEGTALDGAYDAEGDTLTQAYDIEGNPLMETSNELTVMTYNVQWFTGLNSTEEMQEEIFMEYDADIIGFQEFQRHTSSEIPAMAQELLTAYTIRMGDYGDRNALASKYQMRNFDTIPHTTQTMSGQSYSVAEIKFNGKTIHLVVSHTTTTDYEATKVEQVHEVFEAVQDYDYFILLADFNTRVNSVDHPEYTTIMKQFVDAGYNCANCTEQHGYIPTFTAGYTTGGTWYPCDNIITSANIDIDEVIADDIKIGYAGQLQQSIDHIPLIAHLTVR